MEKNKFNAKKIAFIAIMGGLSFVLYLLNFAIPSLFPSFLEINVSDFPALIGGFAFGPVAGITIAGIKILFKLPLSSTCCVGELADFLNSVALVLPSSLYYKKHRNKKGALIAVLLGGICTVVVAVITNYTFLVRAYVRFYVGGNFSVIVNACKVLYSGITESNFYLYYVFLAVVPFNILRVVIVGAITFAVYKRVSAFINKYDVKEEKNMKTVTKNYEQTIALGEKYAKTLTGGDVVLLDGDLGAGKTVFTKGIAKGLGVTDEITSPTYAYMNDYDGKLFHFDCYRLSDGEDAEALGLTDYFYLNGVCVIEWSENIKSVLPKNCKRVVIKKIDENTREIEL